MQLLNPGVFFVGVRSSDPKLPGVFYQPYLSAPPSVELLRDTVGIVVPHRSQAEKYAAEYKPESIFGQR